VGRGLAEQHQNSGGIPDSSRPEDCRFNAVKLPARTISSILEDHSEGREVKGIGATRQAK